MQIRNQSIAVGTLQIDIALQLQDGKRQLITFVNTSTGGEVITLSLGEEATAGAGIVLYPGSSWAESLDSAFIPASNKWYAVSSGANGLLAIHERIFA